MSKNQHRSQKIEIAILTFDCEEYNSLAAAMKDAKKLSVGRIVGAKEIWSVKSKIYWSEEKQCRVEEEIDKVILFFFGDQYPKLEDLLSDPSLNEFLMCTKSKIFVTEEKIPWPDQEDAIDKED